MAERNYTSKRQAIVNSLVTVIKGINGTGDYLVNLNNNVSNRLLFWDEITDWPAVHLNAGSETREYQGGGFKDRYLNITLRCYVNVENAVEALDGLLEDLETVIEENSRLAYTDKLGTTQYTQQMSVMNIDTDEGVLEPLGVGEMLIEVRY